MRIRTTARFALFTLAAWGLLLLAGCGGDPYGDRIVVRLPGALVQSLSPVPWSPQVPYLQGTLLEGLYGYDRELEVVPKIALSTEISADQKRWVFKLDSTKRWSNGDPLRADDFIGAWLDFASPDEVASPLWASFLMYVDKAEEYNAGIVPAEEVGVRAIDSMTIEVRLKREKDIRPFLTLPSAMPLHRTTIKEHGKEWWKPGKFVGNGPYLPIAFTPDDRMVLERNPNYVGEVGNVDIFEIKAGGLLSQLQNYQSGALDAAHILNLGDYRYIQKTKEFVEGEVREQEELGYHGYQVARTVNPLMHDQQIRRALALSVDKERIAETVMGGRVLATNWYGPPGDSMLAGLHELPYDPETARRLLVASGYLRNRPEIYIFAPPSNDYRGWGPVTEALYSMWKEIGFNVVIQPYEEGILNQYAWGTGFYPGAEFERPGLTMYTGKMLWKDPTMMLRLADHTWLFHNFPYPLKEKLKALAIEARKLSLEKNKGSDADWAELDAINSRLAVLRNRILSTEPNFALREELLNPDYHANYARVRKGRIKGNPEANNREWIKARTLLFEAEEKYLKQSENSDNLPMLRALAELERASGERAMELVRKVQQKALDEAWIVPLYSEKLVYLARPWLKGEVLNKFGGWLCFFNLQYMEVDTAAYNSSKGR